MKGHKTLIEMRIAGKKPRAVWVFLAPQPKWNWHWDSYLHGLHTPEVFIEPEDVIEMLDLRFVVGLTVHLMGNDESRLKRALKALQEARAKLVCVSIDNKLVKGERDAIAAT